jgi:hypothetical protein
MKKYKQCDLKIVSQKDFMRNQRIKFGSEE